MSKRLSPTLNENFFKKWSPKMAYVLGFFTADGNLAINPRGYHYIEFNSCDKESIELIRNALNSGHKISERRRSNKCKISYRIQICSREMFEDLIKLGMKTRKSNDINFPKIPSSYLSDFIRGYFDGDGCVHIGQYFCKNRTNPKWVFSTRFTSGSLNFLKGIKDSLKNKLSGGSLYKKNRGFDLAFSTHDSLALFKLMYHNTETGLFLERKYQTFRKAFDVLGLRA